jgi:hypothetical protein
LEVQILSPAPKSSRGGFALSKTELLFSSSFFFPLCAPNLFCEPVRGSPDRLIDFVLYFSPTVFGKFRNICLPHQIRDFTVALSTTSTGTVFSGGGTGNYGGGGNTGVPEPSTPLLSALGLGGLALRRFYS